jgi:DNA-binding MarR family transcriptional regulator
MATLVRLQEQARPPGSGQDNGPALELEEFLPYRLNVVASLASQALARIYGERYGIGVAEWRVLAALGPSGVMTGKAIGAHSLMHKTKVSRAVALLAKRKLLVRRVNRQDMREALLSLTTAGRAVYQDLTPIALDFARHLVDGIDAGDQAVFNGVLKVLTERAAAFVAEAAHPHR